MLTSVGGFPASASGTVLICYLGGSLVCCRNTDSYRRRSGRPQTGFPGKEPRSSKLPPGWCRHDSTSIHFQSTPHLSTAAPLVTLIAPSSGDSTTVPRRRPSLMQAGRRCKMNGRVPHSALQPCHETFKLLPSSDMLTPSSLLFADEVFDIVVIGFTTFSLTSCFLVALAFYNWL